MHNIKQRSSEIPSPIQAEGADEVVRRTGFDRASGTISVPARTVAVLVQQQSR